MLDELGSLDNMTPPDNFTKRSKSSFEGLGGEYSPQKKNAHPSNNPGACKENIMIKRCANQKLGYACLI